VAAKSSALSSDVSDLYTVVDLNKNTKKIVRN